MKTTFILGAGVDRALGLPLAQGLLKELDVFERGPGLKLSQSIKERLGGARRVSFSFQKYFANQGEAFPEQMLTDPALAATVENAVNELPDEASGGAQAMLDLVKRIRNIREANQYSDDQANTIAALAGEPSAMADQSMLRFRGISFTHSTRGAVLNVFRQLSTLPDLTDEDRATLQSLVDAMTDVEDLLTELFAGFFTGKVTEVRKYLYVSWMLWSYMWYKSLSAQVDIDNLDTFYSHLKGIDSNDSVITFNYTGLADDCGGKSVAFHGDCFSYIRQDRGEIIPLDEDLKKEPNLDLLGEFIGGLDIDVDNNRILMPAIVPPSLMKPIINRSFINRWSSAESIMQESELLAVVGYSFNRADNHFNDLFRSVAQGKRVAVINPDFQTAKEVVCQLLGRDPASLTTISHAEVTVERSESLLLVPLKAEEVDESFLNWILGGWSS